MARQTDCGPFTTTQSRSRAIDAQAERQASRRWLLPASLLVAGAALALTAAPWVSQADAAPVEMQEQTAVPIVAQKAPSRGASCTGSAPSGGLIFADLVDLCPIVAEVGSARIERDNNGVEYIAATIDGINYAVDVYNCDPQCADLSFTASFEINGPDDDLMNEWNATRRFGKAFIRDDGDAVIQFAINTRHGISVETFRDDLVWWQTVVDDYVSFIGFR